MSRPENKIIKQKKLSFEHFDFLNKMLTKDQFDRFVSLVPIEKQELSEEEIRKAISAVNIVMVGPKCGNVKGLAKEDFEKLKEKLKDFEKLNDFKEAIKTSELSEIFKKIGKNYRSTRPKKNVRQEKDFNFSNCDEKTRTDLISKRNFAVQQLQQFTDLLGKGIFRKKENTLKIHSSKTHLIAKKTFPKDEFYGHKTLSFSCLSYDGKSACEPDSIEHAFWLSICGFKICHYAQDVTTHATRMARTAYNALDTRINEISNISGSKKIFDKIALAKKSYNARTSEDINGLQFYVFDFDSGISLEEIFERFSKLGLANAIRVIVQTSPNKYHVYLEHEYVSVWEQNFDYNLLYYKTLAENLGADLQACLSTNIYQTPGFINPKSGYTSNICYANKNSKTLTLMEIYQLVVFLGQQQVKPVQENSFAPSDQNDVPSGDILNSPSPLGTYLNYLSNIDPETYRELIFLFKSKNLTGKRNDALLKLFRHFHILFDITDPNICKKIKDKIVHPFFEGCYSNSLNASDNRRLMDSQVRSLFETNKRKVLSGTLNKPRRKLNRECLNYFESIFESCLRSWKKQGHLKGIGRPETIAKALYARLDLATEKCSFKKEADGVLFVEAFTPVEELKAICRHHYRYKNFLEKIYITNGKLKFPLFQLSNFYRFAANKGCGYAKHFLIALPLTKDFWLEICETPEESKTLYDKEVITYQGLLIKICEKKVYSYFSANKPRTLRPKKIKNPTGPPLKLVA
jgi:hypothetical protein